MTDTTDDIAEEISFQSFQDDCRMLGSLLQEVLQREVRSEIMEKVERIRILAQEAQVMYEKFQSHPTAKVSKKARQFVFSFQAMEMMKLTRSSPWKNTGFQNYFEAFIENKSDYVLKEAEGEVGTLSQTLPYIIFLVSPIFVVLLIALEKRI